MSDDFERRLTALEERLSPHGLSDALRALGQRTIGPHPNINYFNERLRDYELAILNIKQMGYEIGRRLAKERLGKQINNPPPVTPASKLCTQADVESDWFCYWSAQLRVPPYYHRKLWEFCYIAQVLWRGGKLGPGQRGLAFGAGEEPLPSLFAKLGCSVLATDLSVEAAKSAGWIDGSQHASNLEKLLRRDICPDPAALARIEHRFVDMNAIPVDLDGGFDFCWSACALEHIGSIEKGLSFIENSLRTLKPGGIAVHTTEFNLEDGDTIDNWPTVLFQRRHIEMLVERLTAAGHTVAPLDFSEGNGVLDGFVDIPPWLPRSDAVLKLSVDGFRCTSVGIIITRTPAAVPLPNHRTAEVCIAPSQLHATSKPSEDDKGMTGPIYLGPNRALVKIASGEHVCVDTNSMDSIDYLLDFGIENHVAPVFRRFLTPKSVVLDIGANVGFYTVTAGSWVRESGQLFSFEANPHTFGLLRRSVYANKLLNNHRIRLVNALVGAEPGKGTLYFNPEELGRATMTDSDHWGGGRQSVEMPIISIDETLPPGLVVDLVKIDVEGHEPFVLKGMEKVIARSPNIRIIIELFDHMVERTFGARRFAEYIDDLGFTMLRIGENGSLQPFEKGSTPSGENYFLLTRSPEYDIARKHITIPADCLSYHDTYRSLLDNGVFRYVSRPGETTNLFYGPYINLPAGRYAVGIDGEVDGGMTLSLTREFGRAFMGEVPAKSHVLVEIPQSTYFEVVGKRGDNFRSLMLRGINIYPA